MIKMNEDMLKQIIIDTIKGEEHLGENLKEQCVDYIEQLQNNWNELKKWVIELQKFKGINQQGFSWGVAQEVLDKMKELEEEKDERG